MIFVRRSIRLPTLLLTAHTEANIIITLESDLT